MKLIEKLAAIANSAVLDKDMLIQATSDPNGRKYSARSEGQVIGMLRPLLKEQKVHVLVTDIVTCYVDATVIKFKVQLTFYDLESDETLVCWGPGTGVDKKDKDTGKAFTYAFKNALIKATLMVSNEDSDNESSEATGKAAPEVTDVQVRAQAADVIAKLWDKWYFHDYAAKELEMDGDPNKVFADPAVVTRATEVHSLRLEQSKKGKIKDVMNMVDTFNTLLSNL